MILRRGQTPLSHILAVRMVATSASVCLLLSVIYLAQYVSDTPRLRQATLAANAIQVVDALTHGRNPADLPLYKDHPQSYGFRIFDRRNLAARKILASANPRWLPTIQHPASTPSDPDGDKDKSSIGTDLLEGFSISRPDELKGHNPGSIATLVRRVPVKNHGYWVQVYMIGDPALSSAPVILDSLIDHVFVPALLFFPALTIAMFLTTRAALRPLERLSESAKRVGAAVARGQTLTPVPEDGMAREFASVAETINAILAKLDRSLQLQKQFTSDVAHELRTPLAVLVLETSRLPPGLARDRIKSDLKDLGQLVNELLRFAQAEDVMAAEAGRVDVAQVARKVAEEAVAEALARRQTIELYPTSAPSIVQGSAGLIEIAIRNLVHNALKYSPPESAVTVRMEPGPLVIVEDRGPGIPPEHRDKVFERFWRVDGQMPNGAGVGLALVRRIAELHDGAIRLEERPGGGARMILSLPAAPPAPALQRATAPRATGAAQLAPAG